MPAIWRLGRRSKWETFTAEGRTWFRWLMDKTTFDQLIWEHNRQGTCWIHVSCKADPRQNRNRVVSSMRKG